MASTSLQFEREIAPSLANLHSLSDDELKTMLEDDTVFESFVQSLSQVKQWDSEKDMLMASNKSLAEYNLTYEPKLKEGKAVLMELYEKARSCTDELETKRAQLESLSSKTSLDTTYALMQASSAQAEEESEDLSEKFLSGDKDMDTETFINNYISLRTKAHLRKIKVDKMGEMVGSQRNRSFNPTPYPTSPPSMPMPGM